jgi:hypothetical protein
MENSKYASRLRYLDADDVRHDVVDYDGLDVLGPGGAKIGDLDGFIVDPDARRLYHLVVDSGGWFSSRRFLLPVGHARLDTGRRALLVDVTQETLGRYPEFDRDRFRDFSDDELRAFEQRTALACCPDEPLDVSVETWGYETRRHYTQPDWWRYNVAREQVRTAEAPENRSAGPSSGDRYQREYVTAREDEREYSPHLDGRAQPGDVLGIETGGETTGIGDTAEDENKRRRAAERTVGKDEEPRR